MQKTLIARVLPAAMLALASGTASAAGFQAFLGAGDRRHDGFRAGGDQQLRRLVLIAADGHSDDVAFAANDLAEAVDHRHVVGLELCLDAGDQRLDDLILARDDRLLVDRCAGGRHAVLVAVLGVIEDLGAVQQRLRRHAAFVEADAAECAFFNEQGLQPGMAGAFCRQVTGRTTAQYDDVVHGCCSSFTSTGTGRSSRAPWSDPAGSARPGRHRRRGGRRSATGSSTDTARQRHSRRAPWSSGSSRR